MEYMVQATDGEMHTDEMDLRFGYHCQYRGYVIVTEDPVQGRKGASIRIREL